MSSAVTTDQFSSFDGLDNRKTVFDLFKRMGRGKPDAIANAMRGGFLQGLLVLSSSPMAQLGIRVQPCGVQDAYNLFIAITGVLGVSIEAAARLLEDVIRSGEG